MEAVVLAGGLGTRLQPVITDVPKPMAPVRNKPFLEYILRWISQYNIMKIVISVGYLQERITSYFGHEFHGVPIEYAREEKPLGTGGALMNSLTHVREENFILVNGDTYFPVELDSFVSAHRLLGGTVSIALKMMSDPGRYGSVIMDENSSVIQFREKNFMQQGLVNGGIYVIRKSFLEKMSLPESFSLEKEILEKYADGSSIKGIVFNDPFIDIGIPGDYSRAADIL